MSLYSRRWFCALSGSVRGHVSEFRNAYKERYDCLSLRADLSKKIVLAVSGQARREAPASLYASIWQPLFAACHEARQSSAQDQRPSINPRQENA
jgi:hypothetical protein